MTIVPKAGDSTAQRAAEAGMLADASAVLGVSLMPGRVVIGGAAIDVDGVSPDRSVLVEIYAAIGTPRGSQPKKLATDILKLGWARRQLGVERCVVVTWDADVEVYLNRPRAWLTAARVEAGVEVLLVPPESHPEAYSAVVAARARQDRYARD